MQLALDGASLGIGLSVGAAAVWLMLRGTVVADRAELSARVDVQSRLEDELRRIIAERDRQAARLLSDIGALRERHAELATTLRKERLDGVEKLAVVERAQNALSDAFKALSADALRQNNRSFIELARETLSGIQEQSRAESERRQAALAEVVAPVRQSLERMDREILDMEKARAGAYEGLRQQVLSLTETQQQLRAETGNLARALRSPAARGRWGEMQLRRVVEMAGMIDHCDFAEQVSVDTPAGRLRPDMLVRLPGRRALVVDAKTPLEGYLDSIQATTEGARRDALARHARHVREHVRQLAGKSYWEQFADTPEFVVLFLPGENFFSAALEHDPTLIEAGTDQRVILATPTTLIALLRAVAYGWRQERLSENARAIGAAGTEVYKRLSDLSGHLDRLGGLLGKAVEGYNAAVGSMDSRLLPAARRLSALHAAPEGLELPRLMPLDQAPVRLRPDRGPDSTPDRLAHHDREEETQAPSLTAPSLMAPP
jgi:DNA recombination protein RmuC